MSGDTWLGGDDYDERIMDYLADASMEAHGVDLREDEAAWQQLKDVAERAKIELSTKEVSHIRLSLDPFVQPNSGLSSGSSVGEGAQMHLALGRAEFEAMTEDLRLRMVGPTEQALNDARLAPEEVDRLILVGGATRIPAVRELARELLRLTPYRHVNPDEVVALAPPFKPEC